MTAPHLGPDKYQPPAQDQLEQRLRAADIRGRHLWVMTAAWLIADPASAFDPAVIKLMDRENIVGLAGPGCYKCEQPYDPRIARKPCRGKLDA